MRMVRRAVSLRRFQGISAAIWFSKIPITIVEVDSAIDNVRSVVDNVVECGDAG